MPSPRRVRLFLIAIIVTVVLILYYRSGSHDGHAAAGTVEAFYHKTVDALEAEDIRASRRVKSKVAGSGLSPVPPDLDRNGDIDNKGAEGHPRAAEQKAKGPANQKAPKPDNPKDIVGVGSSAGGQPRKQRLADKEGDGDHGVTDPSGKEGKAAQQGLVQEKGDEAQEASTAELDLNALLKRAPVLIFSKTWCPHSKRAKHVLLDTYAIDPEPLVVELDEHPHGASIQALLADKTRHSTVPNVLVSGLSIGGADDVAELDSTGKLAEKLERLGHGRVTAAKLS